MLNIGNICKEYGLYDLAQEAFQKGEFMLRLCWENEGNRQIAELEFKRYKVRCKCFKPCVNLSVARYHMSAWWLHAFSDHTFARIDYR